MGLYNLRAVNADGTMPGDGLLGDFADLDINVTFSDVGDTQFQYPVNGANIGKLAQQREVAIFDDQGEVPDTRFIIEQANGNLVAKDGVLYRTWQGRSLWKMFEAALVYPSDWPANPSATGGTVFASATPGQIVTALINASQARGELSGITYNFSATLTSNAAAWAQVLSIEYKAGVNLLQIMQNLVDQGVVEFRMVGRQLEAYNRDTLGTDRTTTNPQLALWTAKNVLEVPEQEVSRDLKNVALVQGDDNHFIEVTDPTSIAAWTRRAMFVSQQGVADTGTLTVIGQANIDRYKQSRRERTTQFTITADLVPQRTFLVGDWLYSDSGSVLERMRVRQAVIKVGDADDAGTCSLVLNDRFMELEVALNRKVEGITGGATNAGGSPAEPNEGVDLLAPKVPAGLSVTSSAYVDFAGATLAQVSASWLQVTQNSDNSAIDDLDRYIIAWQIGAGTFEYIWIPAGQLAASWSPVPPGSALTVKIGAYDKNGNFSGWSSNFTLTAATDTTPPPVPKTPVVNSYLGQLRILWDGTGSAGEAMPADFAYVEVHVNTVNNFTPSSGTMIDQLSAAGIAIASGLPYGTPQYVKLISVDEVGNKSAPSAQATATPVAVGASDIQNAVITGAKLVADAVTEREVANSAIGALQLQFKDIGNLVADGSFEDPNADASRLADPGFTYVINGTAAHGLRHVQIDGSVSPGTGRNFWIIRYDNQMPVTPGDKLWIRWKWLRAATANGDIGILFRFQDKAGADLSFSGLAYSATGDPKDSAWREKSVTATVPANAAKADLYCYMDGGCTTGLSAIDQVEVRKVIQTAVIDDAAITNAKIANVDAVKITTGTLDANRIGANTITTEKLTVGALGDNEIANGGLEDYGADPGGSLWAPTSWDRIAGSWTPVTGASSIAGAASWVTNAVVTGAEAALWQPASKMIPVVPGDQWYLAAIAKVNTAATGFYLRASWFSAAKADLTAFSDAVGNAPLTTTPATKSGVVTVPSNAYFMQIRIHWSNPNVTSTMTLGEVLARRVITSAVIQDGAIITAKIAAGAISAGSAKIGALAVTDAEIGNVNVGKLVAGSLTADITVAARIKTANTGARVELNSTGLKAYDASNVLVVDIGTSGTAYFSGLVEGATVRTRPTGASAGSAELAPLNAAGTVVPGALKFYESGAVQSQIWGGGGYLYFEIPNQNQFYLHSNGTASLIGNNGAAFDIYQYTNVNIHPPLYVSGGIAGGTNISISGTLTAANLSISSSGGLINGSREIILGYAGSGGMSIGNSFFAAHPNGVVLYCSGGNMYGRRSTGIDYAVVP